MNHCYISSSNDPYFNLSLEQCLYSRIGQNERILYLWRNAEVVVIGRFQNPWTECDVDKMKKDCIKLMRRHSGGGAVYQDLGNLCFTLITGNDFDPNMQKELNNDFIVSALKNLSIDAVASGRNDILVGEKKISGAAFQVQRGCLMHHGTLLIDADLNGLQSYLNPSKYKLESKGIKSVRSRVGNLVEFNEKVDVELMIEVLKATYQEVFGAFDAVEVVGDELLNSSVELRHECEMLSSWDWLYGKTPEFTDSYKKRFSWGEIEILLKVSNGIVADVTVYTDSLNVAIVDIIKGCLLGIQFVDQKLNLEIIKKASLVEGSTKGQLMDVAQLLLGK